MKRTKIDLRSLKSVKVLFEGDIYDLACLLLKAYNAKDQRTGFRSRPTVHGLATRYSMLTDISTDAIIEVFNRHGLPLGATVESDEDQPYGGLASECVLLTPASCGSAGVGRPLRPAAHATRLGAAAGLHRVVRLACAGVRRCAEIGRGHG